VFLRHNSIEGTYYSASALKRKQPTSFLNFHEKRVIS
jgi:hypothetical protein